MFLSNPKKIGQTLRPLRDHGYIYIYILNKKERGSGGTKIRVYFWNSRLNSSLSPWKFTTTADLNHENINMYSN